MPKRQLTDPAEIAAIVAKLEINVPVYRIDELDDGTFHIHLYGARQPAHYVPIKLNKSHRAQTLPQLQPLQALIHIPTIGAVTAQMLIEVGVTGPKDLARLKDHTLIDLGVKSHTLPTIREWLREQGY